jgi:hypothetical protein
MKYLGAPISGSRVRIKYLKFFEDKRLKLLDGWPGGSMSLAGRKVLSYASLNEIHTYFTSMFRFRVTYGESLVKIQRGLFWQRAHSTRKYRVV